jgi:glycosidase
MKIFKYNLLILLLAFFACKNEPQKEQKALANVPEWSKKVIWYQIFVERFYNGDTSNDPTPQNISTSSEFLKVPADWKITPWTQDWYQQEDWAKKTGKNLQTTLQHRRYGGDLQGVIDQLDYLQDLGITALYLNPINDAPSLHKYDARNYRHVDVNFGPDPKGDIKLMQSENPVDTSTWVWTAADKLFLKLVDEAHKRGMHIILDYSWNHTGVEFWAWQDILKNQEKSPFKDWYNITSFDNPATPENEFSYVGWLNISSLPEFKKTDIIGVRIHGKPYEGHMNQGVKQLVENVSKRWLAPNGDTTKGIDGYRLDVADQIPMGVWREYHNFIKSVKHEAYLVGEIWYEKYPDVLMNPVPYTSGDVFDAVMFYQIYRPARSFFSLAEPQIDAMQLKDSLLFQWNRLKADVPYAMMNVAATHDTPRLLSSFYNRNRYKLGAKPYDNAAYKTGKPDAETYERVKLYLIHQFTNIGAPQIWNGDEMGMWGADDPDCRKPLWWPEYKFEPENRNNISKLVFEGDSVAFNQQVFDFYKSLIKMRKSYEVLQNGKIDFVYAQGKQLVYKRYNETNKAIYVLFNAGTENAILMLDLEGQFKNLLTGEIVEGKDFELKALSALILEKQ